MDQNLRFSIWQQEKHIGTMQTLDVKHIELFLLEGYKSGSWDYKEIGSYQIRTHSDGATGAIFHIMHLEDRATAEVSNLKKWAAKPSDWQPKARVACHRVAVNTNLQQNDGRHVRYHAMRAGEEDDSEVVSIRISQQLL
ncbi:probable F-box protein At5g36000 [Papaver somniferum]|uniref:probable F-box protein At5g36000 n=1 Tax=Papaver somniferum TaxID=3469 RepID=UPI000E700805|nr:probable F-box protein At5g36000 [Papaver somniferum]